MLGDFLSPPCMRKVVINGVVRMTDDVWSRFSQPCLMCMQVAVESTHFLLLVIVLLAPGCPVDNVSIDEHLLIQNTGGLEVLSEGTGCCQLSFTLSIFVNLFL